jgi:hypothetical protein
MNVGKFRNQKMNVIIFSVGITAGATLAVTLNTLAVAPAIQKSNRELVRIIIRNNLSNG